MKNRYPRKLRDFSKAAALMLLFGIPGTLQAQLPTNIDFALGNFTNWKCWTGFSQSGTAATGTAFGSGTVTSPIGGNAPGPGSTGKSRHAITSGTGTDYYGGFPIVCPAGAPYSMRIGNDSMGCRADRVQYMVHVPASAPSYNIQIQYAMVLQDGAHALQDQSTFQIVAYDSATGTVLPAANNLYIAQWGIPGFTPFTDPVTSKVDLSITWLPWTASTINLSGSAGRTVIVECTVLDCALSGHWAYGYIDVTSAEDSLTSQLIAYTTTRDSAILQGPPGYKTYQWFNQNFSMALNDATDTARTRTLPTPATPEYYNLIIKPYASIGVADTIRTPVLSRQISAGIAASRWESTRIYPNPATSDLNISFPSLFDGTLELFNVKGERVYNSRVLMTLSMKIPTSGFAAGMYTLVVKDFDGASVTRKVTVGQ